MKKMMALFAVACVFGAMFAGCAPKEDAAAPAAGDAAAPAAPATN